MTPQSLYEILREEGFIDWPYLWEYLPKEQQEIIKSLWARLYQ